MGIKDGSYQYYFDNGQLWTESQFKNNSMFTILSNFDRNGKPRDKGILKDGNGTVNFYTEEGVIYLIRNYQDGKLIAEEKQ